MEGWIALIRFSLRFESEFEESDAGGLGFVELISLSTHAYVWTPNLISSSSSWITFIVSKRNEKNVASNLNENWRWLFTWRGFKFIYLESKLNQLKEKTIQHKLYKMKSTNLLIPEVFTKPAQIRVVSFDEQETNKLKIFFYRTVWIHL